MSELFLESLLLLLLLLSTKDYQFHFIFLLFVRLFFFNIICLYFLNSSYIYIYIYIYSQNGFRKNRSTTSQIFTIRRILEGIRAKNLRATLIFVGFTKAFDSIHRGKMKQILLAYGIPKETVTAITILYRNTKVKVRTPDGDTEYFDIVAGVLQGDTQAPYLFIICLIGCPFHMALCHI